MDSPHRIEDAGRSPKLLRLLPELDFGGVESRVALQARLHDRDRYRLQVCAFQKDGQASAAIRAAGVSVDVLGVAPDLRNPRATLALAAYLRRVRPDIVHASIGQAILHTLVASRFVKIPVIVAEEVGMPGHSRTGQLAFRLGYRSASAIVGVTNAVCDYLRNVDRAPPDRVRLIYGCADARYFPEPRLSVVRPPAVKIRILLVARLVPVKNHLFFLDAIAPVLRDNPRVELVVAGDGPLRDAMQARIADLNIGSSVSLLGFRSDVREVLETAHIFALPSLHEGCSISLIEAMASGVHVIGSKVPGIQEVMGPGLHENWTAAPESLEGWTTLLRRAIGLSEAERAELATRAQERAYEQFSPISYVRRVESLYAELLRGAQWG